MIGHIRGRFAQKLLHVRKLGTEMIRKILNFVLFDELHAFGRMQNILGMTIGLGMFPGFSEQVMDFRFIRAVTEMHAAPKPSVRLLLDGIRV